MGLAQTMRRFLHTEATGGVLLVAMMVLALALANSPLAHWPQRVLALHAMIGIVPVVVDMSLLHWINDGLMAVFFLLVALEIKRELWEGELSNWDRAMLPALAALGGMAVPALIYLAFNGGAAELRRGWAIPSATDIAFALGVLSLFGSRVPQSLKVFLAALAIMDDLGAILIIALFYAGDLSEPRLLAAAGAVLVLVLLNRTGIRRALPYMLAGLALWVCLLHSGIHATIAGVVTGLAVPMQGRVLQRLERQLHPWVAFAIMPIFAFANSGLSLAGLGAGVLIHPVFQGVALGLFAGKLVGVAGLSWLLIRFGPARLPRDANWGSFLGMAALTGIGFTMSLFIGALAFPDETGMAEARLGVLAGSLASALLGAAIIAVTNRPHSRHD